MSVYPRPAYLFIAMAFCAGVGVASALAFATWLHSGVAWRAVLSGGFAVMATFSATMFYRRFRNPPSLLTLTPSGFTNEYGQEFAWPQVTKIYKWLGVLFIRDGSKAGWVVRIDPAEVGGAQLAEAVSFIKSHAPPSLTEKL